MDSGSGSPVIAGAEFSWACRRFNDSVALRFEGSELTFSALDAASNRLANSFRHSLQLSTNDRLCVLLDNSLESVVCTVAASKAALTLVPLNARNSLEEHLQMIHDCQPRAIIVGGTHRAAGEALALALGSQIAIIGLDWRAGETPTYAELLAAASDRHPQIAVDEHQFVHRISYTSGTTGTPKGVRNTYVASRLRLANFAMAMEHQLGPGDAMIHSAPLTHAGGNYLLPCLLRGATGVILPKFDAERVAHAVTGSKASLAFFVPTMIRRLLDLPDHLQKAVAGLDRIFYGAAPIERSLLEAALDRFGPIFRQHYGMTEVPQPLSVLYPHEHEVRDGAGARALIGTCGKPVLGVDLRCVRPDGSVADPGEDGEVTIRATGACAVSFWNRPDLEAESIRDGWFHSGDLGRFDALGYLSIVGRLKDMIISGGFNVYAAEVERALTRQHDVVEAAVFGMPHEAWGEVVCAWVVPRTTTADGESIAGATTDLAPYKRPKSVRLVAALPRNHAGKVDKSAIRQAEAQFSVPT